MSNKSPDAAASPVDGPVDRPGGDWRIPDELWERLAPLIPPPPVKPHPLGCHRPRVPDRRAMDAIFFVLRTGCQWNALGATGLCSSSVAHARFQEWTRAGVFEALWAQGLAEYDELVGLDWEWLSMDGAITKAPGVPRGQEQRGAGKGGAGAGGRPQPRRPGQARHQAQPADGRGGHPAGARHRRGQPQRPPAGARDADVPAGAPPGADRGKAAGTVPGQGLRLRQCAGPAGAVRVHTAHPGAGRGGAGAQAGGG